MDDKITREQKIICKKYKSSFVDSPDNFKVGISLNVKDNSIKPINGLRHEPEGDTTGWYIWAGELKSDDDFFLPLHVSHLIEWCPEILKFLGLSPGWRFLLADNLMDIWYDKSLLMDKSK